MVEFSFLVNSANADSNMIAIPQQPESAADSRPSDPDVELDGP